MTVNNNTPDIRFSRFSEDWIRGEVRDVLKIKSGMSQRDIEVTGGIYPILATGGEIGRTNTPLYDKESVLIGRKGTIDKPYYMNSPFWTVDTLFYSELAEDASGLFIFTLFQKIQWRKLDTSTGVPSLTSSTIHSIPINIPKKPEQMAIGKYFQHIDKTIATYQSKHKKTKILKTAFLSKMFPQAEKNQPEIRLQGFSADWIEVKLEETLLEQIKGKAQFDKLSNGVVEYLDAARLNKGKPFLCNAKNDVIQSDILIIWDGSNAGKVYRGFEGALGSTLKAYRTNEKYNSEFIFQHLLKNEKVIFAEFRTPNIPHVVKDFTSSYTVIAPDIEEQTAIGNFFKQLDDTLALQAKQLKALENLKEALLAKMFV